jgi:DNA-binding transcriptional MerR regulator
MQQVKDLASDIFIMSAAAARELEVSSQTIINWEKTGKLAAIKTANGVRLFRRSDIERMKTVRAEEKRVR